MTNEEAAKVLKLEQDSLRENPMVKVDQRLYDAFDVAIKALEQEPILDKIIAEIENTEIKGYIRDVECYNAGINFALHIIAKYKSESEE